MKKLKAFQSFFPALLLAAFFASCATAPKTSFPAEDGNAFSLLPSGGKVYLWADTVTARPLLDVLSFDGRSGKDAAAILDRTESAVAAIFPEGGERRFYLAASGDFPRARASISFTFSHAWKKQKSQTGNSFWFSKSNGIALSLGSKIALVSDSDPFGNFSGGTPPEGFVDFHPGLVLAGWLNNASETVNSFLANIGIPMQIPAEGLFFGAARVPMDRGPWELVFRIKTPSANHARSLLGLFSMARLFIPPSSGSSGEDTITPQDAASMFFTNAPEQNGEFLTIRMDSLDEARIALLFDMFSVYSNSGVVQ